MLLLDGTDRQTAARMSDARGLVEALIAGFAGRDSVSEDATGHGMRFGAVAFARGVSVHHVLKAIDLLMAMLLFAVEYTFIVRYEEGVLESIFGQEYLDYKARTPRWFPRPPKVRESGQHDWGEAVWSERSTFLQYVAIGIAFWLKAKYFPQAT